MPEFAKKKWQKVSEKMHFSAPSQWHKIRFEYQGIIFNEKRPKIFTNAFYDDGDDDGDGDTNNPLQMRFLECLGSQEVMLVSDWLTESVIVSRLLLMLVGSDASYARLWVMQYTPPADAAQTGLEHWSNRSWPYTTVEARWWNNLYANMVKQPWLQKLVNPTPLPFRQKHPLLF